MHPFQKNEVKVKVAARQQSPVSDIAVLSGLILLVIVSVVVLLGRPAGFM